MSNLTETGVSSSSSKSSENPSKLPSNYDPFKASHDNRQYFVQPMTDYFVNDLEYYPQSHVPSSLTHVDTYAVPNPGHQMHGLFSEMQLHDEKNEHINGNRQTDITNPNKRYMNERGAFKAPHFHRAASRSPRGLKPIMTPKHLYQRTSSKHSAGPSPIIDEDWEEFGPQEEDGGLTDFDDGDFPASTVRFSHDPHTPPFSHESIPFNRQLMNGPESTYYHVYDQMHPPSQGRQMYHNQPPFSQQNYLYSRIHQQQNQISPPRQQFNPHHTNSRSNSHTNSHSNSHSESRSLESSGNATVESVEPRFNADPFRNNPTYHPQAHPFPGVQQSDVYQVLDHQHQTQQTSQTQQTLHPSQQNAPNPQFAPTEQQNTHQALVRRRSKKHVRGKLHFPDEDMGGKYEFVRYLGHGSYGHVCQARRIADSSKVAIKKVPHVFRNGTDAKRLLRELRILRILSDHEAIVNLIDILPPKDIQNFDALYLVFEFVDTDLAQLINSQQFFQNLHAQYITYQILLGLKYMHSANIVHRDLKPANVLVNENVSSKICDFGLARCITDNWDKPQPKSHDKIHIRSPYLDSAQRKLSKKQPNMEREMTRHVVTRWYRAPEVILFSQQRKHLPAIDMWSVGCILSELLMMLKENVKDPKCREPLFPGKSCFPLSARDPDAYKDRKDQLNVIFGVIGTPTKEEISKVTDPQARAYLQKLPPKKPLDLRKKLFGSTDDAIDLLRRLLQFDVEKRLSVDQALAHPYLAEVRDLEAEKRHPRIKFEFEDVPLQMTTIYELIVDEVSYYNPNLLIPKMLHELKLKPIVVNTKETIEEKDEDRSEERENSHSSDNKKD